MQEPTEKKEQAPFRILEAILTNCLIEEKSSFHVEKKNGEVAANRCVIKQYMVTCVLHILHVL